MPSAGSWRPSVRSADQLTTTPISASRPRVIEDWPIYLVSLGHGMTHWLSAAFYVLVPQIQAEYGLSYAQVGLFVTVIYASSTVSNIYSGYIVDATGRRVLVQVVSLLAGAAAVALCGLLGAVIAIYAMLAVLGAANNLWHPAGISYLSRAYPQRRGFALSMHALGANLADTVSPLVTGGILVLLTWQQAAVAATLLPVLVAVALACFLLRADNESARDGKGVKGLGSYLTGLRDMFRSRTVLVLCLMSGFRSIGQNGLFLFLPLYLAGSLGASPLWAGVALSALQIGGVVAAPLAGIWSDKVGRRPVVMAGLTGTTVIIVALTLVGNPQVFVAMVCLLGVALFAVRPVIQSWMMDLTPPEYAGSATSALFGTQALLSSLTPLIGGALADAYGLLAPFYFLAAMMLVANLLTLLLPKNA